MRGDGARWHTWRERWADSSSGFHVGMTGPGDSGIVWVVKEGEDREQIPVASSSSLGGWRGEGWAWQVELAALMT